MNTRGTFENLEKKGNIFMKIDKKTYEVLNYKATDIKEGILALTNLDLEDEKAKELKEDLIKQLEELKEVLKTL